MKTFFGLALVTRQHLMGLTLQLATRTLQCERLSLGLIEATRDGIKARNRIHELENELAAERVKK